MATVRFPNVTATCNVPGAIIGAQGNVTARVRSTTDVVVVTEVGGSGASASIDNSGTGRRGGFGMPLSSEQLRRAAGAARACAITLREPTRTNIRTIARRLDELAATRA